MSTLKVNAIQRSNSSNDAITIDSSDNITVPNGTLTVTAGDATLSDGNLVVASGHGIDFSATSGTGDSELLADYEEGTWTPSFVGSTSGSATMGTQVGQYVKIGDMVHVSGYATMTNKNSISGHIRIQTLPFKAKNLTNGYGSPGCGYYGNLTGITAYGMGVDIVPNQTYVTIIHGTGTGANPLEDDEITNTFWFEWAFTYRAD